MRNLKLTEIIALNNQLAPQVENLQPIGIKVLYNITCNQLVNVLTCDLRREGLNPIVSLGGFDNIVQDSYTIGQSEQVVVVVYDIIGILLKSETFVEQLTDPEIEQLIADICDQFNLVNNNLSSIQSIVWNRLTCAVDGINPTNKNKLQWITEQVNTYWEHNRPKNVTLIDLDQILMKIGLDVAIDRRMLYSSKAPYSLTFWKEYATYLSAIIFRTTGKLKKALILDCDNTLWKGILGEDGPQGIDMDAHTKIGQIFNQIQKIAKWLSLNGVIVGLCSKNNAQEVQEVIDTHTDMVLGGEHIVIKKVNWNDKASNLRDIAAELNIGIDSLVFVDDSSFEINLVREQLPMVATLQVPSALEQYPKEFMELVHRYFYTTGSRADVEKTQQYKAQAQRAQAKEGFCSIEQYLKSLEIVVDLKSNDQSQAERIAQLTQKTNQFNLTTKRYTQSQIEDMMAKPDQFTVYSASVGDKFGSSGLTGVVIVEKEQKCATIDSFLMSCRIMGRNIEYAIMNSVVGELKRQKMEHLVCHYLKTLKNNPVERFYDSCGLHTSAIEDTTKTYSLKINDYIESEVNYIKI